MAEYLLRIDSEASYKISVSTGEGRLGASKALAEKKCSPLTGLARTDVFRPRTPKVSPLMRNTSYQARLGKKLDSIKRKTLDNALRLFSHPTDMIRVKSERDSRSQDLISRTIVSNEILPVILPKMENIPLRKFTSEDSKSVLIPSMYTIGEKAFFEVYCPQECELDVDDLLFRIIHDPYSDNPYVLCLQVKEVLATLSYSSILYSKYKVTFFDETLPNEIINILKEASKKRESINY